VLVRTRIETNDDGKATLVVAETRDGQLAVEGPTGTYATPLGAMTDLSFCNEVITRGRSVIDRQPPRRTPFSLPSAVRAGRISLAPPLRTAPACPGGGTARWVGAPSGRGPSGVHARAAGLDVRCRGLHRDRARRAASKPRGARASGRGSCGHVGRSSGLRIIIGRSSVRGAARCHNTHHRRPRSCA
jgi:hypothetical protein